MKLASALVVIIALLSAAPGQAQEVRSGGHVVWFAFAAPGEGPQNDPAYAAFRKGYSLIMEERWVEARVALEEIPKRFPKSPYVDDAAYWSAYALAQTDRKAALSAYAQFLERFPRSRYFEDATADFATLHAVEAPKASVDSVVIRWRVADPSRAMAIQERGMRSLELAVRRMERALRSGGPAGTPFASEHTFAWGEQIDQATRRKLEALTALGDIREDEQGFRTLQDLARDPRQPPAFRSVALRSLTRFSKFDPLPVFVDLARTDTCRTIQETAILCIGQVPAERERAMESLAGLYARLPRRDDQRQLAIIDAAASLGTPRALTFLVEVARSAPDMELQTTAIDNITVAGRDKARNVELLIDLYRSLPPERVQAREAALYGVAEMGTDRAVDFLTEVAHSSSDDNLRRDAVIYLGTIGGTKARNALYEILRSP